MLDQEQQDTKEVFVPARGSLEMANIILGDFRSSRRVPPQHDTYELLVKREAEGHTTVKLNKP